MKANHVLFCGLEELRLPEAQQSIVFPCGFTLTQDKTHMHKAEVAGLKPTFGLLEWDHLLKIPWHFVLEIPSLLPEGPIPTVDYYNRILDTFLHCSWVAADNNANISDTFLIWHSEAGLNVSSNSYVKRYTACSQASTSKSFSSDELADWVNALNIVDIDDISFAHPHRTLSVKGLSPLALYLGNIQLARMASDAALKIMQYCIAFESLFTSSRTEVSHIVAERVAIFRTRNKSRRIETYRLIKKAYDVRSTISHGSVLNTGKSENIGELLVTIDEIARQILKKAIANFSTIPDFSKSEAVESYFLDRLMSDGK